jgi:hypothetical protein
MASEPSYRRPTRTQWARNLRAGAGAKLRVGGRIEPIDEHDLEDGEEKAALLLAICRQSPYFARGYFKVDPKQVTLEQAHELAARYPVFTIEMAAVDRLQGEGRGRGAEAMAQRRMQEVSNHDG